MTKAPRNEPPHDARRPAGVTFRRIEARDDPSVAHIIRAVMTEFGAVGDGFSIKDAEVQAMHDAYTRARCAYFVAERDGKVVAGGGIAPLEGSERPDVCELRKMYALPEARGLGIGRRLLELCLRAAREAGFRTCYLETTGQMHRARLLYERAGFCAIDRPMGQTGHYSCDGWFVLDLAT